MAPSRLGDSPSTATTRGGQSARPLPATVVNHVWAYDFVFDTCANGQTLKCLKILDEWTRECLAIDATDESFNGRFLDEYLTVQWFSKRVDGKVGIEQWRRHYNEVRPHFESRVLDHRSNSKRFVQLTV